MAEDWGDEIGELRGRVGGIEREIPDTRGRVVEAESRLSLSIDRLVERLEKSNQSMTGAVEKLTDGVGSRLACLERGASNTQLLARLAFASLPLMTGLFLWIEGQALSFTRDEVLLLKEQAADLIEFRKAGGVGRDWIHPDRRRFGCETPGTKRGN